VSVLLHLKTRLPRGNQSSNPVRSAIYIYKTKCCTSVAGVYACGEVTTVPYKQIVVSIGEGAKAALAAFEYLLTESSIDEVEVEETTIR